MLSFYYKLFTYTKYESKFKALKKKDYAYMCVDIYIGISQHRKSLS